MRIGFDFDNTIVSYDQLFYKVALEQGVVSESIPANKLAVRDFLRKTNREEIWTEMQGYVYGARMQEAKAFPGVIEAIRHLKNSGHTLAIISHKTKYPYLGQKYDLHTSAREWIARYLCDESAALIPNTQVFFHLTKEEKIARIHDLCCDIFIDDLPEILIAPNFPAKTKRFLFDPESHHRDTNLPNVTRISSWTMLNENIL